MLDPKEKIVAKNISDRLNTLLLESGVSQKREKKWREEIETQFKQTGKISPGLIFELLPDHKGYTEKEFTKPDGESEGYMKSTTGVVKKLYRIDPRVVAYADAYVRMLNLFDLNESFRISDKKAVKLEARKDKQKSNLEEQAAELEKYDQRIKKVLVEYYKEAEEAFFGINNQKEQDNETTPDEWFNFVENLRSLFIQIQEGILVDEIENKGKLLICFQADYLNSDRRDEYKRRIIKILRQKEPVLNIAKKYLAEIYCLESLMEDYDSGQTIKHFDLVKREVRYQMMPDPMVLGRRYVENPNNEIRASGPSVSFSVDEVQEALKVFRRLIVDEDITNFVFKKMAEKVQEELGKPGDHRKWGKLLKYYWELYQQSQ